jgi:aminotransferase
MVANALDKVPQKPIFVLLSLADEPGMISLGVGEPNFDAPKEAIDWAIQSLREGRTHYTPDPGTLDLRRSILEKTRRDNGFEFDLKNEIMVTAGASAALSNTMQAIAEKGDEIIIPAPAYLAYEPIARFVEAKPIFVPAGEETCFIPSIDAIARAVGERTKAIIVCSPNNPTGSVWSKTQLRELADLAIDNDIFVISDELYERIVFDGVRAHSIASFDDMHDHAITINGVSKSYAMTGFRVGWVISSARVISAYRKIHQYTAICASSTSQAAAVGALNNAENHVEYMVQEYDRRRKLLLDRINNHIDLMSTTCPKGSFYMFVNVEELVEKHQEDMLAYMHSDEAKPFYHRLPPLGKDWVDQGDSGSKVVMLYLVAKAKTLTAPGIAFGDAGENFLRLSFAQDYDLIRQSLDSIEDTLEPWT